MWGSRSPLLLSCWGCRSPLALWRVREAVQGPGGLGGGTLPAQTPRIPKYRERCWGRPAWKMGTEVSGRSESRIASRTAPAIGGGVGAGPPAGWEARGLEGPVEVAVGGGSQKIRLLPTVPRAHPSTTPHRLLVRVSDLHRGWMGHGVPGEWSPEIPGPGAWGSWGSWGPTSGGKTPPPNTARSVAGNMAWKAGCPVLGRGHSPRPVARHWNTPSCQR